MKPARHFPVLLAIAAASLVARAEEDYSRRNPAFAPQENRRDLAASPPSAERAAMQERRVDFAKVEKALAPVGERRAPIAVSEAAKKRVLPLATVKRTEPVRQRELSLTTQEKARFSTTDAQKPELVSKYQRALASAQAVQIGRTPSTDRGGEVRLNRFVFRHNGPAAAPRPVQATRAGSASDRSE